MLLTENCGNLLNENVDVIIHQANCFNTMGSGIAKQIREKYPEAYEVDCKTKRGDMNKFGSFSYTHTNDKKIIINMYSQYRYGYGEKHTDYDAMNKALPNIIKFIETKVKKDANVGIPKKLGCVLGGGDWNIVKEIFLKQFEPTQLHLHIVEFNMPIIQN